MLLDTAAIPSNRDKFPVWPHSEKQSSVVVNGQSHASFFFLMKKKIRTESSRASLIPQLKQQFGLLYN